VPDFAANLFRVAASGALPGGETWANVFHVRRSAGGSAPLTSGEATSLWTATTDYYSDLLGVLSNGFTVTNVTVKDQQSATGPSFSIGASQVGTDTADALPNQIAIVATLQTAQGGRRARGRTYVAGWTTATMTQTLPFAAGLLTTTRDTLGNALISFASALDLLGFPMIVWSPTGGTLLDVISFRIGVTYDTQRRRRGKLGEAYSTYPIP
jgi:hypothetical protein